MIFAVASAGLAFGATALALMLAGAKPEAARSASVSRTLWQIVLCFGCGFTGAFAVSRGWDAAHVVLAGTVVCPLAVAAYAGTRGRCPSARVALGPVVFVCLASAAAGDFQTILAGALAAIPFGVGALLFPRPAAFTDALYSAVAGAALGLIPAVFVLLFAALAAIVLAKVRSTPGPAIMFSPLIAGVTLVAVLTGVAFNA